MGFRALIVDDSATIRRIISRCLENAELGISQILEAANGQEALDVLSKHPVDVILTDINMPVMDGMQFLSTVKHRPELCRTPVLVITSECGVEEVMLAVERGAAAYVKKPFNALGLRSQLAPILRMVQQAPPQAQT